MGGWDQNGCWGHWLGGVEWIQLAQDRGRCECGDEPSGSGVTDLVTYEDVQSTEDFLTVLLGFQLVAVSNIGSSFFFPYILHFYNGGHQIR
jgi:hypothetical protein